MAIRDTIRSLVGRPAARVVETPVRELVEEILSDHPYATTADLEALRRDGALNADEALVARVRAIEDKLAAIEKKLGMTVGAVQASTAQLMSVRSTAEESHALASQASQHATSARSTAEAAADGVATLEDRVAAIQDTLGGAKPASKAGDEASAAKASEHPTAVVDDRGRATFEGVGTWRVGAEYAGRTAERRGRSTYIDGRRVRAQKIR